MLFFLGALKLIAEIALMALVGRWLVGLMAGAQRQKNPFYQLFEIVGRPFVTLARFITPRVVLERHLPLVAFLLLAMVWLTVTIGRIGYCLQIGIHQCR
ncbi:MAG: hypothetical protein IAE92_15465 [Burkholderiaceae bacterium]|nr:hypothetical protein [Burkholderiaceae bacterium]